jgi:hypothetical protein
MNLACSVAKVGYGRASTLLSPTISNVRREVGATLDEARKRATMRLLEAVLKGAGIALLLVACALLVYLGAVLLARGAGSILVP